MRPERDSPPIAEVDVPPAVYAADPYEYAEVRELIDGLGLAEPVAITLVRRGHRTPEQARAFLDADLRHDGAGFAGIDAAVETVRTALEAGSRITVHGDYDVDGIAATAILVGALRRAGGDCDWLIPDRLGDGYGLSAATVERLAERGTELLITADCGIACPDEVARAAELGIETIVTDHHRPGPELPACQIVHPEVSGYPFDGLCGAGVAHKLVEQLELALGVPAGEASRDLDLVALATVADLVPLVDENRSLARRGIAELRRARRPGVRALLAQAGVEAEHVDEGDIAFRLAPRINAAGRLYRADAAVELMITADEPRAAEIAAELDAANRERREVEREVTTAAAAALRELPEELREAPGLVLAGEGWHPGVVGIAASRMVERHGRPAILLAIDADGRAKGSGRSVPGFDLLAALNDCAPLLDRFGGHRAAAGLELAAERIDEFRAAFAAAAAAQLPDGPVPAIERIDAVVGAEALDARVAEQLGSLGPFGHGNPAVRLLVPWARVGDVRPMGEQGRHARFSLSSGPAKAAAVAFNSNGALEAAQAGPADLTVRLELNHWNGAVEPRAVLEGSRGPDAGAEGPGCACPREVDGPWWAAFDRELGRDLDAAASDRGGPDVAAGIAGRRDDSEVAAGIGGASDDLIAAGGGARRQTVAHPGRSAVALIGELLSSGSRVLVLSADARRRSRLASLAASPARFGGSHAVLCAGCPDELIATATGAAGAELVLAEWEGIERYPDLAAGFVHVVAVDPPPDSALVAGLVGSGSGYLHEAFAGAGELPLLSWEERWQPRAALAEIYRGIAPGPCAGAELGALLAGSGRFRRPAEIAARCVRILRELGIAELSGSGDARELRVVSSERTELERSEAWRAFTARHEEGRAYLQSRTAS